MSAPAVTGTPQAFGFADTPHLCTYTGGGTVGTDVYDVLFAISDATVAVPADWSPLASRVSNAGSYVFFKNGGSTSAIVVPGAATNTEILWVRINNSTGPDTGATAVAGLDSNAGSASPALVSGTLAEATEMTFAFAALHSQAGGIPSGFVWSTGYTEMINGSRGGASLSGVTGSVAVKAPAGTAAETPSATWTGPTFERYLLSVSFKGAVPVTPPPDPGLGVSQAGGSWWGLHSILQENRAYAREARTQEPLACPNDGEPLQYDPDGRLRCRYDGWVWRGYGQA